MMVCKECGYEHMNIKVVQLYKQLGYFAECAQCYYTEMYVDPNVFLLNERKKKMCKILDRISHGM